MRKALQIIDSISEWTGKTGQWLSVSLVLVVTYEVIMRYVFNKPSLWPFDMACMMGLTLYVLAFAYVLRHKAHVRVDVFYTHLPSRGKAIIDILGALILFFYLDVECLGKRGDSLSHRLGATSRTGKNGGDGRFWHSCPSGYSTIHP